MARKKYTMTEEHKKQISMACSGEKNPAKRPEVRAKISKIIRERNIGRRFQIGNVPWNKGLNISTDKRVSRKANPNLSRGENHYLFGKHLSQETKIKISKKVSESLKRAHSEGKIQPWNKGLKGIHLSPNTEFKKGQVNLLREKNSNWQGGKSFEPYTPEFNVIFKEAIRTRDAFLCLKCGMREEDSRVLFKKRLHVHHIDYMKDNTIKENCCALCQRCNMEVNSNRVHWTKFFQSLLTERYGYNYSEDGEAMLKLENTIIENG